MKLCLILVVICCWLRLGRACEYGSIRKVCKGEKSDRCSPVTRDDAHNDYVILFLFKIPENYEVYLYQLCESTETAANLTLSTVQRRGINCTTTGDQSTPDYLHFRADCGLMLEHEDYILYDFQSLGSTCNLPHQFVFINTTKRPLEETCVCPDPDTSCQKTSNKDTCEFTCACRAGYTYNGTGCEDVDECQMAPCGGEMSQCVNTPGSYYCTCPDNYYAVNDSCRDIDECSNTSLHNCSELQVCVNLDGSYACDCIHGYMEQNSTCVDIDECRETAELCGDFSFCINLNGSFKCVCKEGFFGVGANCTDKDECLEADICGPHGVCNNLNGSYECSCLPGFTSTAPDICTDIDECAVSMTTPCGSHSDCSNTRGSYTCVCRLGYKKDDSGRCIDHDECLDDVFPCGNHSSCMNNLGSYTCGCMTGYRESESGECIDEDECETMACGPNSDCINMAGSFQCHCLNGFAISHDGSCTASNPCERDEEFAVCPEDFEECLQDPGDSSKHKCVCRQGYERMRRLCVSTLDSIVDKANRVLALEPSYETVSELIGIVRHISLQSAGLQDASQISMATELLCDATNFLKEFQGSGGDFPINESVVIVDIMSTVLSSSNFTTASNGSGLSLISTAETYGEYLLNGTDTGTGLKVNKENIIVEAEVVTDTVQDYIFPSQSPQREGTLDEMAKITLPRHLLRRGPEDRPVRVASALLSNVQQFFPRYESSGQAASIPVSVVISSQILGSKESGSSLVSSLASDPVELNFVIMDNISSMADAELRCVFLNLETKEWSTEGVETVVSEDGRGVTCRSTHLTSFAVLLNIRGNLDDANDEILQIISKIGLAISLVCLILTIVFFLAFGKQLFQQVHYFVHLNLCISLFLAYGLFAFQDFAHGQKIPCTIVTMLLHYLFLTVFCWMLCEGVMLYLMLVVVFSTLSKKWWFFLLLGWGPPVVIVAMTYGIFHKNYVVENYKVCWLAFGDGNFTILMFAIPAAIIIVLNCIFMVLVARSLYKNMKGAKAKANKQTSIVSSYSKAIFILLPLVGLTWLFSFNFINNRTAILAFGVISSILNSLQGLFIFVFHVVRSNKVMGRIKRKMGVASTSKSPRTTTHQSQSTSVPVSARFGARSSVNLTTPNQPTPPEDAESGIDVGEGMPPSYYLISTPPHSASPAPPPSELASQSPPPQSPTPSPQSPTPPPQSPTPPPQSPTPPPQSPTPPPQSPTPPPQSPTPPPQSPTPSPQPPTPPPQSPTPPPQSPTPPPQSPTPSPEPPTLPPQPPLPHPVIKPQSKTLPPPPNRPILQKSSTVDVPQKKPVKKEIKMNYFRGNWNCK